MKRIILCVLVVAAVAVPGAQQAPQQVPTFRGAVDLVTVDVSVLDRDGKPVIGLTADDFEIKLDGDVQPVRVVNFVEANPGPVPVVAAEEPGRPEVMAGARQVWTNEEIPRAEARLIVFLIDDLSFAFSRGKELFVSAERFISALPARDLVGFATASGSQTVNPTLDREVILEAMRHVAGQFLDPRTVNPASASGGRDPNNAPDSPDSAIGLQQALQIDRGDNNTLVDVTARECFNGDRSVVEAVSIAALAADNECVSTLLRRIRQTVMLTRTNTVRQVGAIEAVLEAMQPAAGMKQLVLFTDGLAVDIDIAVLKPLSLTAAEAGVQISVMAPEPDLNMSDIGRRGFDPGAGGGASDGRQQTDVGIFRRRIEDSRLLLNGAQTTAEMVGGQFYRVIGDPDPFLERAAVAGSAVYRLGVQAPPGSEPGKDYRLEARVAQPDVSVHANRHAVVSMADATGATPAPTADELLRQAVGAGQSLYGVPLKVATSLRRSPPRPDGSAPLAPLELAVNVEVPADVPGPLMTMFGLVNDANPSGEMMSGRRPVQTPTGQPFLISFSLPVTDGAYHLRFAAADSDGSVGALELPVKAELTTIGPFVASDLLTAWVDVQGRPQLFTLDELPRAATSLQVSVELYPTTGVLPETDVFVEWSLTKVGEDFAAEEREVLTERVDTSLRAGTEFLFDGLGTGTFTIRGRVRTDDGELGSVVTTIRVVA